MPIMNDLASKLVGEIPALPKLKAVEYVNKALQEIKRDYLWSWNIGEGILIIPNAITTGTVSLTQYSATIVFDATAQAAIAPVVLGNPPFTQYQFRSGSAGPLYSIIAYDGAGTATLDRLYTEATNPSGSFLAYRAYFLPPSVDGVTPDTSFLRYLSILNPIQGYSITGRRLTRPRAELNRRDPLRGAMGQPYYCFAYKPLAATDPTNPLNGLMQYELWPHTVTALALLCQYEQGAPTLRLSDNIPIACPETLIMYRALEFAYRWAAQNSGRLPELKGTDWRFLLADIQRKYPVELVQAKRNDKEIMLNILRPGSAGVMDFAGPIDSNFWQSHGLASMT